MAGDCVLTSLSRSCHLDEHIQRSGDSDHAECYDVEPHPCSSCHHRYVEFLHTSLASILIKRKAIFGVLSPHIPAKRALLQMESTEWPSIALAALCGQANSNYACFCELCRHSWIQKLTSVDVDAPIRLSEEAQDAAITVPKATMRSQLISCVTGLLVSSLSKDTPSRPNKPGIGCSSIRILRSERPGSSGSPNRLLSFLCSATVSSKRCDSVCDSSIHCSYRSK
jgi:hypothetical protein